MSVPPIRYVSTAQTQCQYQRYAMGGTEIPYGDTRATDKATFPPPQVVAPLGFYPICLPVAPYATILYAYS
eukprot:3640614-Rhodomonas_salina.3